MCLTNVGLYIRASVLFYDSKKVFRVLKAITVMSTAS